MMDDSIKGMIESIDKSLAYIETLSKRSKVLKDELEIFKSKLEKTTYDKGICSVKDFTDKVYGNYDFDDEGTEELFYELSEDLEDVLFTINEYIKTLDDFKEA